MTYSKKPMAKKFIVITSINQPTEAIIKFAAVVGWEMIMVGDEKTPRDWHQEGVTYLSPADQERLGYELHDFLPRNHYGRKMLGYLYAMNHGAEVIYDTDDDNLPTPTWGVPSFVGSFPKSPDHLGFINIYKSFTNQEIWPRGLPLDLVRDERATLKDESLVSADVNVGVWQGLADEDPDVDAVYRLTNNTPCYFRDRAPLVLGAGTASPFNSQNTAFQRSTFPLLFLPSYVTFRYTDILRGLVAQPILWQAGMNLGFHGATVVQKRNPHNYLKDFESELPCYLSARDAFATVMTAVNNENSVEDNLKQAYVALRDRKIVTPRELELLEAWLHDVKRAL